MTRQLGSALSRLLPLQYEEDELLGRQSCVRCRRGAPLGAPRHTIRHVEGCEVGTAEDLLDGLRRERNQLNAEAVMRDA